MYLAVQSFYYIRLGDFHFITWGVDNVRQINRLQCFICLLATAFTIQENYLLYIVLTMERWFLFRHHYHDSIFRPLL